MTNEERKLLAREHRKFAKENGYCYWCSKPTNVVPGKSLCAKHLKALRQNQIKWNSRKHNQPLNQQIHDDLRTDSSSSIR